MIQANFQLVFAPDVIVLTGLYHSVDYVHKVDT